MEFPARVLKECMSSDSSDFSDGGLQVKKAVSVCSECDMSPEWWTMDDLDLDSPIRMAVEDLKQYCEQWSNASQDKFWHRKSGKVVLSTVICRRLNEPGFVAHRGMNTEVSLACGSLCAERAAISRAASEFYSVSSIVAIATMDPMEKLNPLWPCEVCQSWLAKMRPVNPTIQEVAVSSASCESFAIRINGVPQPPPSLQALSAPTLPQDILLQVALADGISQQPWEARDLVYVDGDWASMQPWHQKLLREAKSFGAHLLVGVHSDELLRSRHNGHLEEDFNTRYCRVLNNRHVDSVLKAAPLVLTEEFLTCLGIRKVVVDSVTAESVASRSKDAGQDPEVDPYAVARELGLLEVVPSSQPRSNM